ncbi:MAG TPA: glycosyltransferase [Acidimicrobiales bacterium]|nr:glycosyltransferase [Acidimicrobiales bacterium]
MASSGGHLTDMEDLAPRLVPPGWRREWLVPRSEQAEALSARGEAVHLMRPTGPRDWRSTIANTGAVRRALAAVDPVAIVSTGAAVALPAFVLGRLRGVELHYIECSARTEGPSLTGRMVARIPGTRLYTQWPQWSDGRWRASGGVFDSFEAIRRSEPRPVRRMVVTLGTQAGYGFRRLVARLASVVPPSVDVLWQVGSTDTGGLGLTVRDRVPPDELAAAMAEADVVVAHSGVGSALTALKSGRRPILVPRRHSFGEHVDDHQIQIGSTLAERRMAALVDASELTWADIEESAAWHVVARPGAPLVLGGRLGQAVGSL